MLVSTAVVMYMDEKRARLRATTIEGYESALRRHVLPRWGSMDVERIDPDDVQRWVDGFELAGAAEKAYKTLRQVIRWSMRRLRLRQKFVLFLLSCLCSLERISGILHGLERFLPRQIRKQGFRRQNSRFGL